jgi:formylglycine-generating enzyme required for sulfatase activity
MKKIPSLLLFTFWSLSAVAQQQRVAGKVIDQDTKAPISGAMIRQNKDESYSTTDAEGSYRLSIRSANDTIIISHVGYRTLLLPIGKIEKETTISLSAYALELKTVTIMARNFNFKEIENGMRVVKDNLYAHNIETTNALYNLFLSSLEESDASEMLKRCTYDLSGYKQNERNQYQFYHAPQKGVRNKKDSTEDYSNFPAVNISHEGAVLFCEWLTQQYNSSPGKKKYKKVKFRLPSLNEWRIAALGYPKFQSWKLDENVVEVVIPPDTVAGMVKGTKSKLAVSEENLWFPWYNAYNYRKKAYNHMNCYLGNFKIDGSKPVCNGVIRPGGDGWTKMSRTASYFPNDMGLYDVVGNVAEMIADEFIACGGSWNDMPAQATIHSKKSYRKPNDTVGFRFFMEIIER